MKVGKVVRRWMLSSLTIGVIGMPMILMGATKPGDDWLTTRGNKIVNQEGNEVWLTGTNWFGFNTGTNVFDGVWSTNMKAAIEEMANRGINFLRIPVSVQMIEEWQQGTAEAPNVNEHTNPELEGMSSLEVFDVALETCKENGMKVMLDIHSAKTDPMGHMYPVWYHGDYTVERYYQSLEWLADRYKNDDTILALDLKNEPHGKPWQDQVWAKWDKSQDKNNWKMTAEEAANRILAINPHVLIVIEGIEAYPREGFDYTAKDEKDNPRYYYTWWGGNLRGVKDAPIQLKAHQSQVVYSPHDYGPLVYKQAWFDKDFTQQTLYEDCWGDNWAYIKEEGIAPLLMGEWGGFMDGDINEEWMTYLRDYMIKNKISHTFWCFNANSGDTGGLVKSDFSTWDEEKYALLKPALWQNEKGQFIGLDHEQPIGKNGITVSAYYDGEEIIPPEKPEEIVMLGDIDQNNKINSTDYALLKRYLLGITALKDTELRAADVNQDESVDEKDWQLLGQYLVGNIDAF